MTAFPRSIRHAQFPRDLLATSSQGYHERATRKTASVEFKLNRDRVIRENVDKDWLMGGLKMTIMIFPHFNIARVIVWLYYWMLVLMT